MQCSVRRDYTPSADFRTQTVLVTTLFQHSFWESTPCLQGCEYTLQGLWLVFLHSACRSVTVHSPSTAPDTSPAPTEMLTYSPIINQVHTHWIHREMWDFTLPVLNLALRQCPLMYKCTRVGRWHNLLRHWVGDPGYMGMNRVTAITVRYPAILCMDYSIVVVYNLHRHQRPVPLIPCLYDVGD